MRLLDTATTRLRLALVPWLAARRTDLGIVGVLSLLPLLFMWDFAFGPQYLHYWDFRLQWLPWQKFVIDSLARGEAPFWNPYLMLGFSQVGESQVGMFYPPNVLTYPLDLHLRLVVLLCFHLALANVSMFALLRHVDLGRGAACFGAVAFGLSGYMFAQMTNYVITLGSAFVPLFVLLLTKYFERRRLLELGLFGIFVAAHLCISHAGTTFMILGGVTVYFFVYALYSGRFWRDMACYGGALLFGVLVAAVQVFPILELKPLSERSGPLSLDYVTNLSYTAGLTQKLSLFFPWMLGNSRADRSMAFGFEEIHCYLGAFVPVVAALVASSFKRFGDTQRRFLLAVSVTGAVGLLLSFGGKFPLVPLWHLLYQLPGFNMFRIPARWNGMLVFGLAVLAAFGLETLRTRSVRSWVPLALGVALPALAVGAAALQDGGHTIRAAFANPLPILDQPTNAFEKLLVGPLSRVHPVVPYALGLGAFTLLYAGFRRSWLSLDRFTLGALALLTFDLFLFESPMNPRTRDNSFFDWKPLEKYQKGAQRFCRVTPADGPSKPLTAFPMNTPAYFGVFSTSGDTPLELGKFMKLRRYYDREDVLDYVGSCYATVDGELRPRKKAFPRAFVVSDLRAANDPLGKFLTLDRGGMKSTVYLEPVEYKSARAVVPHRGPPPEQHVSIERFENAHVDIDVTTATAGLLVMTDTLYPGWHASLDEMSAPLYAAQGYFRGVAVPEGHHRVRLDFRPTSVYYGAVVSILSLFGFGAALVWARRRRSVPAAQKAAPTQTP